MNRRTRRTRRRRRAPWFLGTVLRENRRRERRRRPLRRVVERGEPPPEPAHRSPLKRLRPGQAGNVGAGNMGFRASRLSGQEMAAWREAHPDRTVGWTPTCSCGLGPDPEPDDFELIATPTGGRAGPDPTMETGRRGMNRPRAADEGRRTITRYEQRAYAALLRASPRRTEMEAEAGEAFAHYVRTDRTGARPVPPELLEAWIGRGWIARVEVPERAAPSPVPCVVCDPFMGSGTTALVALKTRRAFVGIELSPEYARLAAARIAPERAQTRLF